jgi:hypothetical protein
VGEAAASRLLRQGNFILFHYFLGGKYVCARVSWGCLSLRETFSDDGNAICIDVLRVTIEWIPGNQLIFLFFFV